MWTVTTLTADHYDAVCALWEQAGLPVKLAGRDSHDQFAWQLGTGIQRALGVWNGDYLIGVVVTTHDSRKGWINRLAVHPDYRRQGIAQLLIVEAERVLNEQGMQIIVALIEEGNDASLALFQHVGYAEYPGIHYVTKRTSQDV
jgi:ribosomal protein S18 acetylase RimI-like enzyme